MSNINNTMLTSLSQPSDISHPLQSASRYQHISSSSSTVNSTQQNMLAPTGKASPFEKIAHTTPDKIAEADKNRLIKKIPMTCLPEQQTVHTIHPKGINALNNKLDNFDKKNVQLGEAMILSSGINSEKDQQRMLETIIEGANKFAVVTTYGIRPLDNGKLSATIKSLLSSIANKQDDPNFTLAFLYNKSTWQQNLVVGKRTAISQKDPNQWDELVKAYNEEVTKEGGKKIENLKCRVFFIAEKPSGLTGSHHNKYLINDNGMMATLGASLGNKTKSQWFDSGAIFLSKQLVTSQRDYFLDMMKNHEGHIGQLQICPEQGSASLLPFPDGEVLSEHLSNVDISSPYVENTLTPPIKKLLENKQFQLNTPSTEEVLWLQNEGNTTLSRTAKPIGKAIQHIFTSAQAGDTIKLRNCSINAIEDWGLDALKRGVNINILGPVNKSDSGFFTSIGKINSALQEESKIHNATELNDQLGKMQVSVFNPVQALKDKHDFNPGDLGAVDHGKVYILDKADSRDSIMMTGTHNLDGQSFKRSRENMLVINPQSSKLDDALFNHIWDACPTLTENELLELTNEAQRYHGIKAQPFSVAPLDMFMQPQVQGISTALRDKLGIK
ncbi:hypothetical protein HQQ94_20540 [Shewanella sp. VB17]|uniref:phospholipase D-like domain-containing protein n=1 Tax=Shewanella sp. VB17 TaxID=2739432 RepID=UPI001563E40B|nr:phospholipase D-like domain-containing protein [Shewanella sp. VB17]NRD75563.1 hypothetical protein [Shewanella sp. VB17]